MKRTHNMVFNVASVAAVLTAGIAAITIWLLLAQPLSVATAVNMGDLSALARAVAAAIAGALGVIFQYL